MFVHFAENERVIENLFLTKIEMVATPERMKKGAKVISFDQNLKGRCSGRNEKGSTKYYF